ncbi:MAG: hypothetical protein ACK47B_29210 [Armatimonadota bacterium]
MINRELGSYIRLGHTAVAATELKSLPERLSLTTSHPARASGTPSSQQAIGLFPYGAPLRRRFLEHVSQALGQGFLTPHQFRKCLILSFGALPLLAKSFGSSIEPARFRRLQLPHQTSQLQSLV